MKRFFLMILIIFMGCFLSGCSLVARVNAKEINDNSNFEIALLTKADEVNFEGFQVIPGFGINRYYDSKYGIFEEPAMVSEVPHVCYDISGFPDTLGERYVTGIYCSDPSIDLFGYSVGDSVKEFKACLEDRNFTRNSKRGSLFFEVYEKGRMEIRFGIDYNEQDEGFIRDFYVRVDTTNFFMVVY